MAEFCFEWLQKFEPDANECNTVLTENLELCEGCGFFKKIVIEFIEGRKLNE